MASDNRNGNNGNGRPGNGHRTEAERDIHRAKIVDSILRNPRLRQVDIAAKLGIDRSTVNRDIKFIRKEAVEFYRAGFEIHTARLLTEFMELARTAYEGYEASREDGHEQTKMAGTGGKSGSLQRATVKTIGRYGDARFLLVVEGALTKQGEILGIFKPQKHEISGELSFAQAIKLAKQRREDKALDGPKPPT